MRYEQRVGHAIEGWVKHCRLDQEGGPRVHRGSTAQRLLFETVMRLVNEVRAESLQAAMEALGGKRVGRSWDGVVAEPRAGEAEAVVESDAAGFEAMGGEEELSREGGRGGG